MSNKRKIIFFSLIGVSVIIIAALIFLLMNPGKTTIYTFRSNFSAGKQLDQGMLVESKVDTSTVTKDYITDKTINNALKGDNVLKLDVTRGMPLMKSFLSIDGGNAIEQTLHKEKVAVTVAISKVTGVTNDLKKGSIVNVYASGGEATTLVLKKMTVIAVQKDGEVITGVTLECSEGESIKLVNTAANNSIYLGITKPRTKAEKELLKDQGADYVVDTTTEEPKKESNGALSQAEQDVQNAREDAGE